MKEMVDYSLYKFQREGQKQYYWFVQFKDPETSEYYSRLSVDSLSKRLGDRPHHITKKSEAENVVQRAITSGLYDKTTKEQDPLFVDYLRNFWDFDNSKYINRQNKLNPHSIGKDHAYTCLRILENHAIPRFPQGLKCSQVKTRHIEEIMDSMLETHSVGTWIKVRNALSVPIKELRRKRILLEDPFFYLPEIKPSKHKGNPKGCLTRRETDKLLFQMFNNCTYPKEVTFHYKHRQDCKRAGQEYDIQKAVTLDRRVYLATALASCSGMRKGEILALKTENIRFPNFGDDCENQAIIDVVEAYARMAKFKEPKSKKTREVPIPRWLADELLEFASTNPWGNGLVFYSSKCSDTPFDDKAIGKAFNKELAYLLGVQSFEGQGQFDVTDTEAIMKRGEEIRKERNITFHSTRHYFDTQSFNTIGGEKTRLVIGHESEQMTKLYYNPTEQEILQIGTQTTRFITKPKNKEA